MFSRSQTANVNLNYHSCPFFKKFFFLHQFSPAGGRFIHKCLVYRAHRPCSNYRKVFAPGRKDGHTGGNFFLIFPAAGDEWHNNLQSYTVIEVIQFFFQPILLRAIIFLLITVLMENACDNIFVFTPRDEILSRQVHPANITIKNTTHENI